MEHASYLLMSLGLVSLIAAIANIRTFLNIIPSLFACALRWKEAVNLGRYQLIVMYNNADVKSLYENFPEFKQGDIRFIAFGHSVAKAMEEAGLEIAISAPTTEVPSVAKAIEVYIENHK